MSSHADTIRDYIKTSTPDWSTPIPFPAAEAWDAVTALLAENQRLREALRFYAYNPQYAGDIAREALAGDAE